MAVCRRARCIKLTLFSAVVMALVYTMFPEEVREALSKFAPPSDVQAERREGRPHKGAGAGQNKVVNSNDPVLIRQRHSESEVYLTPGNPGNFEPMREEEGEGPGERGEAHRTGAGQAREVDEAVNDYGMNIVASDEISLDR